MGDKHQPSPRDAAGRDAALRAALERLDQAIDRLEAAVDARGQSQPAGSDEGHQALEEALAREARSREEGKQIAGKLDGLINRLETVLGT